MDVTMSFEGTL